MQRFEPYLDTCILMSLLAPDSGSNAADQQLLNVAAALDLSDLVQAV